MHHFQGMILRRFIAGLLAGVAFVGGARAQSLPGPQGPAAATDGGEFWLIPSSLPGVLMRATVYRPQRPGAFPLALINHGTDQSEIQRFNYATPTYPISAHWFLKRGYAVVVPQRPGHGGTGGPYLESQGSCEDADYLGAGLGAAASIQAAIDYMTREPFVRRDDIVAIGQSAGGWGALALASRNPPGLKAAINVAGGRGGHSDGKPDANCAPDRLVAAAGRFGSTARVPTLWLYSRNDSYFAPALAQRMALAFGAAGGRAEFRLLPALPGDGHDLLESRDGAALWEPAVAEFLRKVK
ncbi:MAG TPA: CocE/NonD family hydrolase [Xanthobacteraceae bacterium]|jgi:dienelactone hydrolase|nr:CocE/NonD family hydrolase [Xanthobacteraceae bacterium]